jgi:hypothetical protein
MRTWFPSSRYNWLVVGLNVSDPSANLRISWNKNNSHIQLQDWIKNLGIPKHGTRNSEINQQFLGWSSNVLFLINIEVHCCVANNLGMDNIQSHYNQVLIITPYFSKTCLNIILISMPNYLIRSHYLGLPIKRLYCVSHITMYTAYGKIVVESVRPTHATKALYFFVVCVSC